MTCIQSKEIDNQPNYIWFHTTDRDTALSIADSDFRTGTWEEAKSGGDAHIIAEIRMGKVCEFELEVIIKSHLRFNPEIYDYSTLYMLQ
jgi:hypothetical protein